MIQKCPNCGQWCETAGTGMLQRFGQGWNKSVENAAEFVGGDSVIGNMIGGALGGYTGLIRGGLKSLFGDKYEFQCPTCGYEWGTDDESEDQTEDYLREQRQNGDEVTEEIDDKYNEYSSSKQYQKGIAYFEELLKDSDYEDYQSHILRKLAALYSYNDDNDAAIDACSRGVALLRNYPWSYDDSFLRLIWYRLTDNLIDARNLALMVSQNATDETLDDKLLKDVALEDFNQYDEQYAEIFTQFDYKDRKAIYVAPNYTDLSQKHVDVFTRYRLPKEIVQNLPVGHPIENQVYVGHPYLPGLYLPIETYQFAFVEDRVREFCEIAQALGATEITVEALNTSHMSKNGSYRRNVSGGGSYEDNSANGTYENDQDYSSVEEKYQALNFHQEYYPRERPHLPEKMVWYQHEPRWQRLYNQRLKGILTHEERIETRSSQVVSGNELTDIKTEVKSLFEMNGEWTETMEEKFTQEENAILSIKVKFAPLSELTQNAPTLAPEPKESLTIQEKEYLEEVKLTLEDGEIGPRERKALERNRIRLGLSEDRAAQLEATVSIPQLTSEEKEYLEEVRAMLEDGEIGPRERKMLERRRIRLGISEERAKQIESI